MSSERFENYWIGPICDTAAAEHHNIQAGEYMLALPKAFPYQTLDPVPINGHSDVFFGDCETQSRRIPVVGSGQDRKQGITGLNADTERPT